jgi:hypothetical protein
MTGSSMMEAAVNNSDGSIVDFLYTMYVTMTSACIHAWEAITIDPKTTQRIAGSILIVAAPEFQKPTL